MEMKRKQFPRKSAGQQEVLKELDKIGGMNLHYRDGRILNSICSEPLDIALLAYEKMIASNLGDARLFPGMVQMEQDVVSMLGDLLHNDRAAGNVVTGGTEANLLAMYVARRIGEEKGIEAPEIVASESIHFSFHKACTFLNIKLITIKTDSQFRISSKEIENAITPNTIAIVATAGTSETGTVDPIEVMAGIAREQQLYFHVDAASGGFLLPFMEDAGYPSVIFDFMLEGVHSITVDPHKYGLSVIPSGFILFRDQKLQDYIQFPSFFHGTKAHTTFSGTRTGAGLASVYAVIHSMGYEGFVEKTKSIMKKRTLLVDELWKRGIQTLGRPDLNIIMIQSRNPLVMMEQLEKNGWIASVSRRYDALRVVVHHHNSEERLMEFSETVSQLERTIVSKSRSIKGDIEIAGERE